MWEQRGLKHQRIVCKLSAPRFKQQVAKLMQAA